MSPYLPLTEDQIVSESLAAARAGATVLHLQVRDPKTGRPSSDAAMFERVVQRLRAECDAILSITTGGSAHMTIEERLEAPIRIAPELCSLNLGTMNFALHPMARKERVWEYEWEKPFLEATKAGFFKNTFADMERVIGELGERFGTPLNSRPMMSDTSTVWPIS